MLNSALTVVDNHASLTLPGSLGSMVYDLVVTKEPLVTLRRIAATTNTTPQILAVKHEMRGAGFNQRVYSEVKANYQDLTTDASETGGIIPQVTAKVTFEYPVKSGGAITSAIIKNTIGAALDVVLTSGQLDKLLNQEA